MFDFDQKHKVSFSFKYQLTLHGIGHLSGRKSRVRGFRDSAMMRIKMVPYMSWERSLLFGGPASTNWSRTIFFPTLIQSQEAKPTLSDHLNEAVGELSELDPTRSRIWKFTFIRWA